jgi:hypothetical protein
MSLISLVGTGGFQSPSGAALANGQLKVELLEDTQFGDIQACAGRTVWFDLDENGNVSAGSLWGPAEYDFTAYSSDGQPVWQMFVNFSAPPYY